jgi:alpha-glucosidase
LFVRWFQLASFLPFFRTHCTSYMPPREPWEFGAETEAILAKALRLRERLLPYWYTLAWQAGRTGAPPARPPCWAHPESAQLRADDDAFLLGDALLVAPVFEPNATRRSVTLPPGEWRELEGDGRFTGPGRAELDAPLERIPVLVRAGSVLPVAGALARDDMEAQELVPGSNRSLQLMVFRPAGAEAGGGLLYSDAGDGYGPNRVDHFELQKAQGGWNLSWSAEGEYPWPYEGVSLELRGFRAPQVRAEGAQVPAREGRFLLAAPAATAKPAAITIGE